MSLQIYNAENCNDDSMMLYFENKQRSGGGEVEYIYKIDDCTIVQFCDLIGEIYYN